MASVDIAIPCYQYGRFLRACVESVLDQGIEQIRILIIDNASTDCSLTVARDLAARDPRITVLANEVNRGPHASFNAGIDWAKADYFMVLCADDMLVPGALKRAVAMLEQSPDAGVATGRDLHWHSDTPIPPSDAEDAQGGWRVLGGEALVEELCRDPAQYFALGMMLTRTRMQKSAGHYRPELPSSDDLEMLLRLALQGRIAVTGAVQGIRRIHDQNRSQTYIKDRIDDLAHRKAAFESFFAREGRQMRSAARLERMAMRNLAARAYWWAVQEFCRGRPGAAAGLLRFASTTCPGSVVPSALAYLLRENGRLGRTWTGRALARIRATSGCAD